MICCYPEKVLFHEAGNWAILKFAYFPIKVATAAYFAMLLRNKFKRKTTTLLNPLTTGHFKDWIKI